MILYTSSWCHDRRTVDFLFPVDFFSRACLALRSSLANARPFARSAFAARMSFGAVVRSCLMCVGSRRLRSIRARSGGIDLVLVRDLDLGSVDGVGEGVDPEAGTVADDARTTGAAVSAAPNPMSHGATIVSVDDKCCDRIVSLDTVS